MQTVRRRIRGLVMHDIYLCTGWDREEFREIPRAYSILRKDSTCMRGVAENGAVREELCGVTFCLSFEHSSGTIGHTNWWWEVLVLFGREIRNGSCWTGPRYLCILHVQEEMSRS